MTSKESKPQKKWEDLKVEDNEEVIDEDLQKTAPEMPILTHAAYEELANQLSEAETKSNENWQTVLRLQADMDNLRRRNERDLVLAHKHGLEKIAQELLPVMDSLERGLEQMVGDGISAFRTGAELTLKQLQAVFEKFGIKTIDPLGKSFDPALHEAMAMRGSDSAPGTVVEVLQKGFQLNDRLLRPALVVVSKAP